MKTTITALILAAGEGKRLWPLTGTKALFSFAGEPLLFTNMRKLASEGIRRFVVVVSPSDEKVVRAFSLPGVSISTVVQKSPAGMGDAVVRAKDMLEDAPTLIMNAHDVVDDDLYRHLILQAQEGVPFVVGKKVDSYVEAGYLQVAEEKLVGIVEKPGAGKEPSNLINLVFHFFPRPDEFIVAIKSMKSKRDDLYEQALSRYLEHHEVRVFSYGGMWHPLKFPWHVLDLLHVRLAQLTPKRGKNVHIAKNVFIEGNVVLEDGVRILENTKIIGPCYIGANTIVGNNCIIRESHIGAESLIGFNSDVTRSWVGEGCWFHSNYVGDSVVAGDVSMGGGTKLANLRLDDGEVSSVVNEKKMNTGKTKFGAVVGSGVRVGVNASIMPGVKVGAGSFVGAGVVLDKDLPDDSFCYARVGYEVKPNTKRSSSQARNSFKAKL